jgi:hypothetical protein
MPRIAVPLPMRALLVGAMCLMQTLPPQMAPPVCPAAWHLVLLAAGHGALALVPAGIRSEAATRFVERLCYTAALRSTMLFFLSAWWQPAAAQPLFWLMAAHDTLCFVWDMQRALAKVPGGEWTRVCLLLFAFVTAPALVVHCGAVRAETTWVPFARGNLLALLFTELSGTVSEWCLPT